jgi:hypothetical protein
MAKTNGRVLNISHHDDDSRESEHVREESSRVGEWIFMFSIIKTQNNINPVRGCLVVQLFFFSKFFLGSLQARRKSAKVLDDANRHGLA